MGLFLTSDFLVRANPSAYDSAYIEFEWKNQEKLKKQSLETGKLTDDVVSLEIKNSKDFEGLTILYKRIFNYLLYKNKELAQQLPFQQIQQDSAVTQFNVEKEVAAALESIIPRAALGPFVSLNPSEKITQLVELSNLVIGIRLFNKEIEKGEQLRAGPSPSRFFGRPPSLLRSPSARARS